MGEGAIDEVLNGCLDEHTPQVDAVTVVEDSDVEVDVVVVDRPLGKFWIMLPLLLLVLGREIAERAADAMA